jgi:hypothetical protein
VCRVSLSFRAAAALAARAWGAAAFPSVHTVVNRASTRSWRAFLIESAEPGDAIHLLLKRAG